MQLEEEAIQVCEGEMVDCSRFVDVRRLDGKCNNLRNKTTTSWGTCTNCTNWGASAIKMRRMTGTAYSDFLQHKPREVKVDLL